MSYDVFAALSLSWPDAFSALAMDFSGAALFAALRLSRQITRKVDNELGELAPNFALYPGAASRSSQEGARTFELRIDNYNRRPIRVTSLRVEQPGKVGLIAYHLVGLSDMLLGDMDRPHNQVFTSLVIEGTPPGASDFNSARIKLVVSGHLPTPDRRKGTTLAIRIDFDLLRETPEKRSQVVSLQLHPRPIATERSRRDKSKVLVPAE